LGISGIRWNWALIGVVCCCDSCSAQRTSRADVSEFILVDRSRPLTDDSSITSGILSALRSLGVTVSVAIGRFAVLARPPS
jgi:hypothetical protein